MDFINDEQSISSIMPLESVSINDEPPTVSGTSAVIEEDEEAGKELDVTTVAPTSPSDSDDPSAGLVEADESEDTSTSKDEDKTTSKVRGELPPLQNPHILEHRLFKRCPLDILKTCRLVCRQWHDLSLARWRSLISVNFTERSGEIWVYFENEQSRERSLRAFFEFAQNPKNQCSSKPFRRMWLTDWKFTSENERISRFFDFFGKNLTELHLRFCHFTSTQQFRRIIYRCCPNLQRLRINMICFDSPSPPNGGINYQEAVYADQPNLKSLIINYNVNSENENTRSFHIPWIELLSKFPSLTFLDVSIWSLPGGDTGEAQQQNEIASIINALDTIRQWKGKKLKALKHVTFSPRLQITRESYLHALILPRLGIPLQEFEMSAHIEIDKEVETLLECHMNTLKFIQIVGDISLPFSPPYWTLPCQVELLTLDRLVIDNVDCKNMNFLKYTPNLRELSLFEHRRYYYDELPSNVKIYMIANTFEPEGGKVKLEKMKTLGVGYTLSADDISKLVKWMPNLEELTISLNDQQFAIVCEHWRKLKNLKVLGDNLTNEGITGRKKFDEYEGALPNITFLQELERFRFFSENRNLTDVSVFHGFLYLPTLRNVRTLSKPTKLGEVALKCLKENRIKLENLVDLRRGVFDEEEELS